MKGSKTVILADGTKLKEGSWVFNEFELKQIKRIEDGKVKEVSDGVGLLGGYDLVCFPVTMKIKRISDNVAYYSNKLDDGDYHGLNYPDIHRWLRSRWEEMCNNLSDENVKKVNNNIELFYTCILKVLNDTKDTVVCGVRVFK